MDDNDFFDLLYAQWTKTTGAGDSYWMPEEDTEHYAGGPGTYNIWAVNADQSKAPVWSFEYEDDADFITAIHGCFGDLVRQLHAALDEAERYNVNRDERECRIAELELENAELEAALGRREDRYK